MPFAKQDLCIGSYCTAVDTLINITTVVLLCKNTRFVDASKADGLPKILQKTKGSKYSETKVLFSLSLVQNTELADHFSTKRGVLSHANMKAGPMLVCIEVC